MEEKKYTLIDGLTLQPHDIGSKRTVRAAWLDDNEIPGAPYFDAVWVVADITEGPEEHCHDFEEYLGFMSGDPTTYDLGCTVEFEVDGDVIRSTKNCILFVPPGVKHCPFRVLGVTRPVLMYSGGPNVNYQRKYNDGTYRKNCPFACSDFLQKTSPCAVRNGEVFPIKISDSRRTRSPAW